jgi:hypothetical protein
MQYANVFFVPFRAFSWFQSYCVTKTKFRLTIKWVVGQFEYRTARTPNFSPNFSIANKSQIHTPNLYNAGWQAACHPAHNI